VSFGGALDITSASAMSRLELPLATSIATIARAQLARNRPPSELARGRHGGAGMVSRARRLKPSRSPGSGTLAASSVICARAWANSSELRDAACGPYAACPGSHGPPQQRLATLGFRAGQRGLSAFSARQTGRPPATPRQEQGWRGWPASREYLGGAF